MGNPFGTMSQWHIFLYMFTSVTMANSLSVILSKKSKAVKMAKGGKQQVYPSALLITYKVLYVSRDRTRWSSRGLSSSSLCVQQFIT